MIGISVQVYFKKYILLQSIGTQKELVLFLSTKTTTHKYYITNKYFYATR